MRTRLTFPDSPGDRYGQLYTEVYPSADAAQARLAELGQLQVEVRPAGKPQTRGEVIQRYPCLVGHIICDSLGYFTPQSAAGALLAYIEGESYACEWYCHQAGGFNHEKLLQVGKEVVERAFKGRRQHKGYMAHYPQAKALVGHVRGGGEGPVFASWF
jgi:hypothetical protein